MRHRVSNLGARRRGECGGLFRARRGFTLIELIAVLLIVAIIAATAAPAMSGLGDTRAAMAAKHMLRDLAFARQRAVATGTPTWVVIDTAGQTWTILTEDPDNPGRSNATTLPDPATNGDYVIDLADDSFAGVSLTAASFDGAQEIGFDWLGRPLNAAESSLAAQGSVTFTGNHRVTVEVTTGLAKYVKP